MRLVVVVRPPMLVGRLPVTGLGRPHVPVGRPQVSVTVLPVPRERLLVWGVRGLRLLGLLVVAAWLLVLVVTVVDERRFAAELDFGLAAVAAAAFDTRAEASDIRDARIACRAASPSRRERSTKDCADPRRDPERCDEPRERALTGVDPGVDKDGDPVAEEPSLANDAAASLAGDALGVV